MGVLMSDGIGPLRVLRRLSLDISNSEKVSQPVNFGPFLPEGLEELELAVSNINGVRSISLGHLTRCRKLSIESRCNDLLSVELPSTLDALTLDFQNTRLERCLLIPVSIAHLELDLDATVMHNRPHCDICETQQATHDCFHLRVTSTGAAVSTHRRISTIVGRMRSIGELFWASQDRRAHCLDTVLDHLPPPVDMMHEIEVRHTN